MSPKKSRAEQELVCVEQLMWLQENNPPKFAEMMRLLARLVAKSEAAVR